MINIYLKYSILHGYYFYFWCFQYILMLILFDFSLSKSDFSIFMTFPFDNGCTVFVQDLSDSFEPLELFTVVVYL